MSINSDKAIFEEAELQIFCDRCRDQSKKIVLATGGFDLLHPGHLRFLEKARELGDVLIVGINGDDNIRKTKGENRPLQNQRDRAYLVAGFSCVSAVHIITGNLFHIVRPDIFVMSTSSNQKPEDRKAHHELVNSYGGKVVVFDPFSTTHSSALIENMKRPESP